MDGRFLRALSRRTMAAILTPVKGVKR